MAEYRVFIGFVEQADTPEKAAIQGIDDIRDLLAESDEIRVVVFGEGKGDVLTMFDSGARAEDWSAAGGFELDPNDWMDNLIRPNDDDAHPTGRTTPCP